MENDSGGGSGDIERENDLVDLSKRKHVQCRLRTTNKVKRPIFLIITPEVMSIAEVVVVASNASPSSAKSSAPNQVKNTSVVPVHLIDAIVDSTDNKTLHLTVFSNAQPKLFQQLGSSSGSSSGGSSGGGSRSSSSSLSCWRMTVGFANPGACSWTKATLEKHRAELRREKLGMICTMLGISDFFSESTL